MSYKRYQKKSEYSYALGIYPTIELLKYKPHEVIKIILSKKSKVNKGVELVAKMSNTLKIPIEINDNTINQLSTKENCLGIGIFNKYSDEVKQETNHIVLVNPSNAGNLGTIIRTMAAFSREDLVIISPGVDFFNPEVIRASMGSVFKTRINYFTSINDYINKYSNRKLFSLMTDGNKNIENIRFTEIHSLIFGNESSGLPEVYKSITESLRINTTSDVDSLNLSIAVGIVLYESSKH